MNDKSPFGVPQEIHSLRIHIELDVPVTEANLSLVKEKYPNWFNAQGELLPEPKQHGTMKNFKG